MTRDRLSPMRRQHHAHAASSVYARLVDIPGEREYSESGREALRGIKAELIAGTFPYLEKHLV